MGANTTAVETKKERSTAQIVAPQAARAMMMLVMLGMLAFFPAGTLRWPLGWAMLGTYVAGLFVTETLATVIHPGLFEQRVVTSAKGVRGWDHLLTGIAKVASILIALPVAGLDYRFGWSPQMPLAVPLVALGVSVLGHALSGWAMVTNAFFAGAVRIQTERGHSVIDGGPYRIVRHPAYAGWIAMFLTMPLVLGSLWALLPAAVAAAAYVIRTAKEDRTLQEELPGYAEYTQRTRYRLLPGIW